MANFIAACRLLFEQNLRNANTKRHNVADGMHRCNLHATISPTLNLYGYKKSAPMQERIFSEKI